MSDFKVVTDGSGDLSDELLRERNITVVPFFVQLGSGDYLTQHRDITETQFYEWMVANPKLFPKSSMPSTQSYVDVFKKAAQEGEELLCLCITKKFSNSYQTACIARQLVLEEYPDAKIVVKNTQVNTVLQGLVVLEACELRDAHIPLETASERLDEIIPTGRIFFTIGSLDYLAAGGRIGKLAGKVSGVLGIRPIITLKEGEIFSSGMVRGRAKSLDKVVDVAMDYVKNTFKTADEFSAVVGYCYDKVEAEAFSERVEGLLSGLGLPVKAPCRIISSPIGVHTGPHALGFACVKKANLNA